MKAKGIFIFKSVQLRDGGKFKNDRGEEIPYKSAYIITCDEQLEDGQIKERKLKFPQENATLAQDLGTLQPYQKIELSFDVDLYSSNAKVTPIGFKSL